MNRYIFLLVLLGITPIKSEAEAIYTVDLRNNFFLTSQTESSPNPLTKTFSTGSNHSTAEGTGTAGNGIHENDLVSNRLVSQFGANGSTTLTTTSAYDDIMFFDVANPSSSAFVNVTVSADFTASSLETPLEILEPPEPPVWGSTFELVFNLGRGLRLHPRCLYLAVIFPGRFRPRQ